MAINFPNNPVDGQTLNVNNVTYTWSATRSAWIITNNGVRGFQGFQGVQGPFGTTQIGVNPPAAANNGDTWWDSESGTRYVYYNDGSSTQWVQETIGSQGVQGAQGFQGFQGVQPDISVAYTQANAAYAQANSSYVQANNAYIQANAARTAVNTTSLIHPFLLAGM